MAGAFSAVGRANSRLRVPPSVKPFCTVKLHVDLVCRSVLQTEHVHSDSVEHTEECARWVHSGTNTWVHQAWSHQILTQLREANRSSFTRSGYMYSGPGSLRPGSMKPGSTKPGSTGLGSAIFGSTRPWSTRPGSIIPRLSRSISARRGCTRPCRGPSRCNQVCLGPPNVNQTHGSGSTE